MPHDELPSGIYTIDVQSAQELHEYTVDAIRVSKKGKMRKASINSLEPIGMIQKTPYLFMVAAVSDFRPKYPQSGKLKRATIGQEWSLELTQNSDILKSIDKDGILTIGFKAEMDSQNGAESATSMIEDKGVDAVCYNLLADSSSFGTDSNQIDFITRDDRVSLGRADKLPLSFKILEQSQKILTDRDKERADV
jgi:phosphopantothenoylcysteine decarboxylase/phosphopantothenate--cysteine ligase